MHLPRRPADHRHRLAEVGLRMTRCMRQWHEHLPRPAPALTDVVLHDGVAPGEPVLVPQTIEDLLRCVALLAVRPPILFQDPIDDTGERIELWTTWRTAPPVARRYRERQHLGDRLAVDPETVSRFPSAQSLTIARQSDTPIKIHSKHPPAFQPRKRTEGYKVAEFNSAAAANRPLTWTIFSPPFSVGHDCRNDTV